MGFIPETTCRRCGQKYSGLRNRCPNCGTPRQNQPNRVPHTTASATPNTAASRRAGADIRWQLIFGGILLVAVILAVVVLIAGGGKDSGPSSGNRPSVTNNPGSQIVYSAADLPTPSPSPIPTPEASPTPVIEQMAIAFLNNSVKNHSLTLTNAGEITIDLDLNVFPSSDDLPVTWSSSNEKILTVDDRGIVTVVGASPNITVHAVIIAECGGLQDYVTIYVPAYQAAYLTQNLYDPETYEQMPLNHSQVEDAIQFVKENTNVTIRYFKGSAFSVEAPNFVELEVTQTEPGFKGDTATNNFKPATVETGYELQVPLFINIGDKIKIDTRSGEYLSRA